MAKGRTIEISRLSAAQLLEEWAKLQRAAPRKRGAEWKKHAQRFRREIERRIDAGDTELDRLTAEALANTADSSLLPVWPEGHKAPMRREIGALRDSQLQAEEQIWKRQLGFLNQHYPDLSRVSDWQERGVIATRKIQYQGALREIHREMARRGILSADSADVAPHKKAAPRASRTLPDVAKRRAIVRSHPELSDEKLCALFDFQGIPVPPRCEHPTWKAAYKDPKWRSRIHTMLSKDRCRGD